MDSSKPNSSSSSARNNSPLTGKENELNLLNKMCDFCSKTGRFPFSGFYDDLQKFCTDWMKLSLNYEEVLLAKMKEMPKRFLKTVMDETEEKEDDLQDPVESEIIRLSYMIWDEDINGSGQTTDEDDYQESEKSVGDLNYFLKNENVVEAEDSKDSSDESSRISGDDSKDLSPKGNEDGSFSSS